MRSEVGLSVCVCVCVCVYVLKCVHTHVRRPVCEILFVFYCTLDSVVYMPGKQPSPSE